MYSLIGLSLGLGFYIIYLLSPFIGGLRRKLIKWDDGDSTNLILMANYYYVESLKNPEEYKYGYVSRMSDGEFIFGYLFTHMLLGVIVAAFIGITWPAILAFTSIILTIKKVLKSIKSKNKTK